MAELIHAKPESVPQFLDPILGTDFSLFIEILKKHDWVGFLIDLMYWAKLLILIRIILKKHRLTL